VTHRRKILLRFLFIVVASVLALALIVWRFSWTSPPEFTAYEKIDLLAPIMTARQYDEVISFHERPYVYELKTANGSTFVYGAEHTKDPSNPQINDIRQRWRDFNPNVALVESRMGFLPPLVANPVRQFGETGLVYGLARNNGSLVYTWEPPLGKEISYVLKDHPKEQVAMFYVLRSYFSNLRHGRPANPEAFVEEYLRKRMKWPGIENTLKDISVVDSIWKRDFPDRDWRDESDQDGLPGYLGEIATRSNAARDEHLTRMIIHLVGQGHRVFAVMGSSHAVKIELALRATLQ
jgi:hypothetical protein